MVGFAYTSYGSQNRTPTQRRAYSRQRVALRKYVRQRRVRKQNRKTIQKWNKTKNVLQTSLGKSKGKRTTDQRLKALETGSKHHHDKLSLTGELITWNGTALNAAHNSYSGLLAVQGALADGTQHATLEENEQRQSDEIFCTSVHFRGEVIGIRPGELLDPTGTDMTPFGAEKMKTLCATRIYITVLQDMRPSSVDAAGQSQVNPLPTAVGQTPMETIYDFVPPTNQQSQLQLFGVENAMKSYGSSRFKIVHQECIETSLEKVHKFFDIKIKVNRKLKYVPPRSGSTSNPPMPPYNYNLLVYFTCVTHPVPLPWATLLSPVAITTKSSRMYFIDA